MDQKYTGHRQHSDQQTGGERDTLRDRVCGMVVIAVSEHRAIHDGQIYYFCSAGCRGKFRTSPGDFLGNQPGDRKAHEYGHSEGASVTGPPAD